MLLCTPAIEAGIVLQLWSVRETARGRMNDGIAQMAHLKTMPVSPKTGQPLYSPGAIRDVFELVAMRPGGATMSQIRAVAKSKVALYPITKHCRRDGKRHARRHNDSRGWT